MQVNPEIEPNLRATVRGVIGGAFTDRDITTLENRALDAAKIQDLPILQGIQAGTPVWLTRQQKTAIDRLVGTLGSDELGHKARGAYGDAVKSGQIRVR
jgi:hypothetical protein